MCLFKHKRGGLGRAASIVARSPELPFPRKAT